MEKEAYRLMRNPNYYGAMAVRRGDADGLVTGATMKYKEAVTPILRVIGTGKRRHASGLNIVIVDGKLFFFCDTTVNVDPSAHQIAATAVHAARSVDWIATGAEA